MARALIAALGLALALTGCGAAGGGEGGGAGAIEFQLTADAEEVAVYDALVRAYLVTDGGPDRATLFLPIYVYDVGFEQLRYGYAAAMTVAMHVVTALILLAAWRVLRGGRLAATG